MSIVFLLPQERSRPLRQRLLMPWRWPRWMWCAFVLGGIAGYFLSAVPVTRILRQSLKSPHAAQLADLVYQPVWTCDNLFPPVAAVIAWEHRVMDALIGPELIGWTAYGG